MKEIRWPQTIPKQERIKLDTGHRSFCLHRLPVGDQFDRQSIRLSGHLLILVVSGCVVVQRGKESQIVEAGEAVVIPEGRLQLTEVPAADTTHSEAYYYFFNAGVLRDVSATNAGVEAIALRLPPWPGEIGVIPKGYRNLTTFILAGHLEFPRDFSKVLTLVTHQFSVTIFAFLTREFFLPKLRLNLFMEQHLFETPAMLRNAYPGGREHLERALRLFQGLSVDQWLRRRRTQLARLWMGDPEAGKEEIAVKLGYSGVAALKADLPRGKLPSSSSSWRNVRPTRRRLLSAPFWLPTPDPNEGTGISASIVPEPTPLPEPGTAGGRRVLELHLDSRTHGERHPFPIRKRQSRDSVGPGARATAGCLRQADKTACASQFHDLSNGLKPSCKRRTKSAAGVHVRDGLPESSVVHAGGGALDARSGTVRRGLAGSEDARCRHQRAEPAFPP